MYIGGGYIASFTLLSEDLFIVSRFSQSYEAQRHIAEETCGFLDMYRFNPQAVALAATSRVASFSLPFFDDQGVKTFFRIRRAPAGVTQTSRSNFTSLPKVFDLSPNNRLLCVSIYVASIPGTMVPQSAGTLCVPSSLLLNSIAKFQQINLDQPQPIIVPWADWAEETSWVGTGGLGGTEAYSTFGQRMAKFVRAPTNFRGQDVLISDFDQHRLRSRHLFNVLAEGEAYVPGSRVVGSNPRKWAGKELFYRATSLASRKYVELTLSPGGVSSIFDIVMIDDEHSECMLIQVTS